jgi:hypothetical protein
MGKNYDLGGHYGSGAILNTKTRFRNWMQALGMNRNPERSKRFRFPVLAAFGILGALVIVTFFLYMVRLSSVTTSDARTDGNTNKQVYGQVNLEIPAPGQVAVTVDKGATIKWNGEEDVRIIGYNVYRYTGADDPGSKVNSAIVSDTVYHDDDGTMFNSYAVAPVDANGRQGVVSTPVDAVADPRSLAGLTPTQQPEEVKNTTFEGPPARPDLPASIVDCTAGGMTYNGVWYLEHYAEVTGGTLMVTPYPGGYGTYTFAGDSVTVIATRHWNYGILDIYIDGELRQEVDLYSPAIKVQDRIFTASGLGPGAHTIKMVCTGRKNPQAFFTFIDIEALEVR